MQAMTELEDPAAQTLCEPARSKGAWTCHKSHFMREFRGKNAADQNRDKRFVRAGAVEKHLRKNLQEKSRNPE
jgi:hypothetical protein